MKEKRGIQAGVVGWRHVEVAQNACHAVYRLLVMPAADYRAAEVNAGGHFKTHTGDI